MHTPHRINSKPFFFFCICTFRKTFEILVDVKLERRDQTAEDKKMQATDFINLICFKLYAGSTRKPKELSEFSCCRRSVAPIPHSPLLHPTPFTSIPEYKVVVLLQQKLCLPLFSGLNCWLFEKTNLNLN